MVLQYNLIVSEIALKEFDDAFYYYKKQRIGLETEFAECINNSFITICKNTFAFQKIIKQIRHFVVDKFPFVIYYKIYESKNEIIIISVFHSSRNPNEWKKRI